MNIDLTTYAVALRLVRQLDYRLSRGLIHIRDRQTGRLLLSLDEVIRAILEDRIQLSQEIEHEAADAILA